MTIRTLSIGGMGGFELGLANAGVVGAERTSGNGVAIRPVAFCEREPLAAAVLRARARDMGWDTGPTPAYYTRLDELEHAAYTSGSGQRAAEGRGSGSGQMAADGRGSGLKGSIDIFFAKFGRGIGDRGAARDGDGSNELFNSARKHQRVATEPGHGDRTLALIRFLQPEWAILEAPCEILTADHGSGMRSLLAAATGYLAAAPDGGLRSAGCTAPAEGTGGARYGALWRVLDLRHFAQPLLGFGWPQRRERLYIVLRRGRAPEPEILLDTQDLDRISGAVVESGKHDRSSEHDPCERETDAGLDDRPSKPLRMIPFDGRSGAANYSPIVARDTLPAISGQNVAFADEATHTVRWMMPAECELAYTLPHGWTASGIQTSAKGERRITLKDAPRYRMLGKHTVPPAIIEWIARRMIRYAGMGEH